MFPQTGLDPKSLEGEFFADYQVRRKIASGPVASTYHVHSNVLRKEFALKIFEFPEEEELEELARWDAQFAALRSLQHKNVDGILGSGLASGCRYLLKDFVQGCVQGNPCLHSYLRRQQGGRLSLFQLYHLAKQLLCALQYAADEAGLHHGNLKPSNVLIAQQFEGGVPFEIKLADFNPYGLGSNRLYLHVHSMRAARLRGAGEQKAEREVLESLRSLFSSYDYRAPEGAHGRAPSVATDIYSLGAILYECITGFVPYGSYPMPSQERPDLSPAWDQLISTCLQYYPDLRYQSYDELLADLHELGREIDCVEAVAVEPKPPRRERYSLTPQGMVYLPPATFSVGSEHCGDDAYPPHSCETSGFYIDRTPVTNAQFHDFVRSTGYETEAEQGGGAPIWIEGEWRMLEGICWRNPLGEKLPDDFALHPVVQVTYQDALAYCEWKDRRLPTEQEWEYAATAGQAGQRYPWGQSISRYHANYASTGTTAVMAYPANSQGLHDMIGNVWEWTDSWYLSYPGNPKPSPHFGEKYRVVRGGAWMYDGSHCQSAYRNANQPERCYPTVGFRTVRDLG